MKEAMPEIDPEKCTGCGDCVEWCPTGAVALANGKAVVVRSDGCDYCTDCETVCPPGAISCPFEIILVATEPHRPAKNNERDSSKNPDGDNVL